MTIYCEDNGDAYEYALKRVIRIGFQLEDLGGSDLQLIASAQAVMVQNSRTRQWMLAHPSVPFQVALKGVGVV